MSRKDLVDRVLSLLSETERVRNISVIAHVDHGKSTLTNTLVSRAGLMKANNTDLFTDFDEDEKEKGITIKSTAVSMEFLHATPVKLSPEELPPWTKEDAEKARLDKEQGVVRPPPPERKTQLLPYLINLIDSPGHVDFSSEVSAALRVTDGALVVVDCVEGVRVQTKTVLRQALTERIKPVLFLNKLDRVFLELNKDPEEIYQTLRKTIESVNVIIATYQDQKVGDWSVYPQAGTVAFGSGLQGWAFGLRDFARVLHAKFNISEKKMMKKLWGDNFWDPKKQEWSTQPLSDDGRKLQRGFTVFVLHQLRTLFQAIENKEVELYSKFMTKFGAKYDASIEELPRRKDVVKHVMQACLPAAAALVDQIVMHLPSPVEAQKYRVEVLYSGPMDDACAQAIRNCDPKGPVMMYVSKMVPTSDYNHFYAFGRVFSGTLRTGETVRIMEGGTGEREAAVTRKLPGMVLMMGPYTHSMQACPPGALVGLVGVDALLVKTGTVTTDAKAFEFVTMKHSVSPVVRRAVEVANPAHLNKLTQALKRLSKADSMVQIYMSQNNEHILAGCGELHLEMCVSDLRKKYLKDVEIKISDPVVSYCETVDAASDQVCLAKSPNKLNRVFMTAEPLSAEVCLAVDSDKLPTMKGQEKPRARMLAEEYKWDLNDAKKIWCFGLPPDSRANVLVDKSRAVPYLAEIKDTLMTAFAQSTLQGVYTQEPLRGVRFNVEDAKIHADPAHRGAGQIIPAASRAMAAAQMSAKPRLLEPIYLCEVTVGREAAAGVYDTLRTRRATIVEEVADARGGMVTVRAHLPVSESFGFSQALRKNTSGQAFPELLFSHWGLVPGLITDEGSPAYRTAMAIRQRKGLKPELPAFNDYNDKL